MKTTNEISEFWFEASEEAFTTAESLFESGRYVHCMFFCHLALEKSIKSLFVAKFEKEAPFTHNLVTLASKMNDKRILDKYSEFFAQATAFNISSRYEDYKQTFRALCTPRFAGDNLKKTKEVLGWLRSLKT